ncbi:MAG: methyltransferase family protein [Chloroflexota bacterium]
MTRIPALGPRGEGWLVLQAALMVAIPLAAWSAAVASPRSAPRIGVERDIGTVLLLAGVGLMGISTVLLRWRRAWSALPRPVESGSLVDTGPYAVIRHPIYAGLVIAAAGVALIRSSALIAFLTLALFVVLDLKRRREEAWLVDRYPGYSAYKARTTAFVPFLY